MNYLYMSPYDFEAYQRLIDELINIYNKAESEYLSRPEIFFRKFIESFKMLLKDIIANFIPEAIFHSNIRESLKTLKEVQWRDILANRPIANQLNDYFDRAEIIYDSLIVTVSNDLQKFSMLLRGLYSESSLYVALDPNNYSFNKFKEKLETILSKYSSDLPATLYWIRCGKLAGFNSEEDKEEFLSQLPALITELEKIAKEYKISEMISLGVIPLNIKDYSSQFPNVVSKIRYRGTTKVISIVNFLISQDNAYLKYFEFFENNPSLITYIDISYNNIKFIYDLAQRFPEVASPLFKYIFNQFKEDKLPVVCAIIKNFSGPLSELMKKDDVDIYRDYNRVGSFSIGYTVGNVIKQLINEGQLTLENYKSLVPKLLNPIYQHNNVMNVILNNYIRKSTYILNPKYLKFRNADKFAEIFNSIILKSKFNFKDVPLFNGFINYLVNSWGKDVNFALPLAEFFAFSRYMHEAQIFDLGKIIKLIIRGLIPCNNLEQLSNIFRQYILIGRKLHNLYGASEHIWVKMGYKRFDLLEDIIVTFIVNKYDPNNDVLSKALDLVLYPEFDGNAEFLNKCSELNMDGLEILRGMQRIKQQFAYHKLDLNKAEIYDLDNKINIYESYEGIKTYKQYKKEKVPELFNLNYTINERLKFEVLPNNSMEYFIVGAATGCCQRLIREGAAACVDSYINPLAGVLTLKGRIKNKYIILAQSYFHYVPEDNGFIIDNVETDAHNVKAFQVNLDSLYASLGRKLKEDYDVQYFICGMEFNKLQENSFEIEEVEDNRHFEQEELGLEVPTSKTTTSSVRYTDFDGKGLNLLKPKDLPMVDLVKMEKTASLSLQFYMKVLGLIGIK